MMNEKLIIPRETTKVEISAINVGKNQNAYESLEIKVKLEKSDDNEEQEHEPQSERSIFGGHYVKLEPFYSGCDENAFVRPKAEDGSEQITTFNGKQEITIKEDLHEAVDVVKEERLFEEDCPTVDYNSSDSNSSEHGSEVSYDSNSQKPSTKRMYSVKCHVCKESFQKVNALKRHFALSHVGEKPYKCSDCEKCFASRSLLNRHLLFHGNEKPHKCEICEKSFVQKGDLKQHFYGHMSERPHKCPVCGKGFTRKSGLNGHLQLHNGGDKPHKCSGCEKSFPTRSILNRHLVIHEGEKAYKCDLCEKSFFQKNVLKLHVLVHTGERPHVCNVCERSFARKSALTRHLRVHTGEKPHECHLCEKRFTNKRNLNKHLRVHDKKNETTRQSHKCETTTLIKKEASDVFVP